MPSKFPQEVDQFLARPIDTASMADAVRKLEQYVLTLAGGSVVVVVPMAGDVTGTSAASVVSALRGFPISTTPPTAGQVLADVGGTLTWVTPAATGVTDIVSPLGSIAVVNPTGPTTDIDLAQQGATFGQVLTWNGSQFLPASVGSVRKAAITLGDGSSTLFNFTHALSSTDVVVDFYETGGSKRWSKIYNTIVDANTIQIQFSIAPPVSSYRCIVTA